MKLGIVVTAWNALDYLMEMTKTIMSTHPHIIIIVDNHSIDGTTEWVKHQLDKEPNGWALLRREKHFSLGSNRNAGSKLALELGCSHIIWSAEDVLLHRNCIDNLVAEHEKNNFLLTAGVSLIPHNLPEYWNKITEPLSKYLGTDYLKWIGQQNTKEDWIRLVKDFSTIVSQKLDTCIPHEGYDSPSEAVVACVRQDFFDKVGYYDEGYTEATVEAVDLIHRCNLASGRLGTITVDWENVKAWSSQLSLFFHWGGGCFITNEIDWRSHKHRITTQSYERYLKKWGGPLLNEKWTSPIPQPSLWDTEDTYEKLTRVAKK